ncbi:hypothetical protein GCM10020367_28130 [Streptomyces sannanensis]|uniref:Uncharacterized protein n=1 Tax=Streptomyces sannanensis TaxID=285536 RepID=A0ABP6SBI6_9ACTN
MGVRRKPETARNVLGSLLALAGATAAVWSPFRAWYDGREGRYYRFQDLFTGITGVRAGLAESILLPLVFAAAVAVTGVVLRSRAAVATAGGLVLGFTILWMVRQGQALHGLSVSAYGNGLGVGVANAFGGGLLMLLGAAVMSGRRVPARRAEPEEDEEPPPARPMLDTPAD